MATAVNKQLNFTVKNKPRTTSYIYCIFEAYFMIKSVWKNSERWKVLLKNDFKTVRTVKGERCYSRTTSKQSVQFFHTLLIIKYASNIVGYVWFVFNGKIELLIYYRRRPSLLKVPNEWNEERKWKYKLGRVCFREAKEQNQAACFNLRTEIFSKCCHQNNFHSKQHQHNAHQCKMMTSSPHLTNVT